MIFTTTDNGWFSFLSPTGRYVAYGNGNVRVQDLERPGRELQFPSQLPAWVVGWFSDVEIDITVQPPTPNQRTLSRFNIATGVVTPLPYPQNLAPGYAGGSNGDGHTVWSLPTVWIGAPGGPFRLYDNGNDVTPAEHPAYNIQSVSRGHYLYRSPVGDFWPSVVRRFPDHALVREIPCPGDWRWFDRVYTDPLGRAWTFSQVRGVPVLNHPSGLDYSGPPGEEHGLLEWSTNEPDNPVVWTTVFQSDGQAVQRGRPLNEWTAAAPFWKLIGVWQINLDVAVLADGRRRFSGYNGGGSVGVPPGTLTVDDVPPNAARVTDSPPPAPALPSLDRVPRVAGPFGFICYTFNDAKCLGNINLPIRPSATVFETPIVLPSDRPDLAFARNTRGQQNEVWAVYAPDGSGTTAEKEIPNSRAIGKTLERGIFAYQDSFPTRASVLDALTPSDVAGCVLKRGPTENLATFVRRAEDEFARVSSGIIPAFWPVFYPVLNLAQETPLRAVETFIAICQTAIDNFWPGFALFALGRSDVPAELMPYVERFAAGITGVPRARIFVEEPMPAIPPIPNDLLGELNDERNSFHDQDLNRHQCVEMLNRVARRHPGWGLLKKESGNHGERSDGAKCSVDYLVFRTGEREGNPPNEIIRGVDCLSNAGGLEGEGPSGPQWPAAGSDDWDDKFPIDRFVEPIGKADPDQPGEPGPIDPGPGPGHPPPLDPNPIGGKLDGIANEVERIGHLADELKENQQGLAIQLGNDLRAISERLDTLKTQEWVGTASVKVLGRTETVTFTMRPKGATRANGDTGGLPNA